MPTLFFYFQVISNEQEQSPLITFNDIAALTLLSTTDRDRI